jgi:hypothetical protein
MNHTFYDNNNKRIDRAGNSGFYRMDIHFPIGRRLVNIYSRKTGYAVYIDGSKVKGGFGNIQGAITHAEIVVKNLYPFEA